MIMLLNEETQFRTPVKRIFDSQSTFEFQSSVAAVRLKYFIQKYSKIVHKVSIPDGPSTISVVNEFVGVLERLSLLVDQTPPLEGPRRYGNLACRSWHAKFEDLMPSLWKELLPDKFDHCIVELVYYLGNSFGSSTRLDYGTGHELSFLAVIGALDMIGMFTDQFKGEDFLLIMNSYYSLVRKLILTYTLEPAGSHGVWGLDDHFHLAYIFGSAQWANYKGAPLRPRDILNPRLVQEYANRNLYCQTIAFIYKVKNGPFREHSSMLYDLAMTVHSWAKLESGLMKMYAAEVLNKFPVVQHFWFGTGFYPWTDVRTGKQLPIYEASGDDGGSRKSSNHGGNYTEWLSPTTSTAGMHQSFGSSPVTSQRPESTVLRTRMGPPTSRFKNSISGREITKR